MQVNKPLVVLLCCSKFDEEVNSFVEVLTELSLARTYKQWKRLVGNSQIKVVAIVYRSSHLQELLITV